MANIIRLAHRSLLILRGSESASLLQGLLTNDLRLLNPDSGLAAFLLNNKGRIVEDLLLSRRNDDILLECSSSGRSELKSTLEKYRMRKKVEVIESDDIVSFSTESGLTDPRLPEFGFRVYGENGADNAADYFSRRVRFGIAESKTELAGLLPFQANGDLLNYVSLDKGCYIGQELTARTAHTGVVRRRIVPFSCNENVPSSPGKEIVTDENGKKVGQVICREMLLGLALLPLNSLEQALFINQQPIHAKVPSWMNDVVTARKL